MRVGAGSGERMDLLQTITSLGSGAAVGFVLGLIGRGGSILATPLLLYVVGVAQPHVAIADDEITAWIAHRRAAVATAAGLVEQQRTMLGDQLVEQRQRRRRCADP